ncbi:hypothetical protein [Sorangium sp. So ce887]|uniref:hypothetical protein n=1 Tax=Sorangium sp. So ce887 TaxID=3133324 RepID=UPI003F5F5DF3
MARTSDRDRILGMLSDAGQGLSNQRIRTTLGLGEERYDQVRTELLDEGLIEKYRARGGAIRLTRKGERQVAPDDEQTSQVEKESELYPLLVSALDKEFDNDLAIAFDTGRFRKRGQWKNPDVTAVAVEVHRWLHRREVQVTTYEVKRYGDHSVTCVFEAASHASFAHQAYVVLEWHGAFDVSDVRIGQLLSECQKFGVGLSTLEKHYKSHRVIERLAPVPRRVPLDRDVEEWLEYAFDHDEAAKKAFLEVWAKSEKRLGNHKNGN